MPTTDETPRSPTAESFIHERARGRRLGEKDLVSRAGAKDTDELIRGFNEWRRGQGQGGDAKPAPKGDEGVAAVAAAKKEAPREEGESAKDYDARIKAMLNEALGPIRERFAAEDAAKKKQAEEAAAKERAEAERKERDKALRQETAWFQEVALGHGALDDDKKLARLTRAWNAELSALPPEEFEKLFGEGVPDAKQRKNAQKILDGLREDMPGLFAKVDPQPKPGEEGQKPAAKAEEKPALKPATTGASSQPPGSDKAGQQPAAKLPPFDARKLSDAQYRQYTKDPKAFKALYEAGEIKPARA